MRGLGVPPPFPPVEMSRRDKSRTIGTGSRPSSVVTTGSTGGRDVTWDGLQSWAFLKGRGKRKVLVRSPEVENQRTTTCMGRSTGTRDFPSTIREGGNGGGLKEWDFRRGLVPVPSELSPGSKFSRRVAEPARSSGLSLPSDPPTALSPLTTPPRGSRRGMVRLSGLSGTGQGTVSTWGLVVCVGTGVPESFSPVRSNPPLPGGSTPQSPDPGDPTSPPFPRVPSHPWDRGHGTGPSFFPLRKRGG